MDSGRLPQRSQPLALYIRHAIYVLYVSSFVPQQRRRRCLSQTTFHQLTKTSISQLLSKSSSQNQLHPGTRDKFVTAGVLVVLVIHEDNISNKIFQALFLTI